jgi:CheY-like chemotaxis protein
VGCTDQTTAVGICLSRNFFGGRKLPSVAHRPFHMSHDMILVLDDDAHTAKAIAALLERSGLCVYATTSPADALDVVAVVQPSCIVLDYLMPGMTGLEVLRAMRTMPGLQDVPVVFYTATVDATRQREAKPLAARHWLPKAMGPAQLLGTVREAVGVSDG